jgi:hypothetical protein
MSVLEPVLKIQPASFLLTKGTSVSRLLTRGITKARLHMQAGLVAIGILVKCPRWAGVKLVGERRGNLGVNRVWMKCITVLDDLIAMRNWLSEVDPLINRAIKR